MPIFASVRFGSVADFGTLTAPMSALRLADIELKRSEASDIASLLTNIYGTRQSSTPVLDDRTGLAWPNQLIGCDARPPCN
jgi:hypothetical protein